MAQSGSAPALGDQGSQYRTKIRPGFSVSILLEFGQRGVAQSGSAPALGAGGPRFESGHPDHHILIRLHGGSFMPAVKRESSARNVRIVVTDWGVTQPGIARRSSPPGPQFESTGPDETTRDTVYQNVASRCTQLRTTTRASVVGSHDGCDRQTQRYTTMVGSSCQSCRLSEVETAAPTVPRAIEPWKSLTTSGSVSAEPNIFGSVKTQTTDRRQAGMPRPPTGSRQPTQPSALTI